MVDHCRWLCRSEKLAKQATVITGLTQIFIHLKFFKSVLSCFLKQCAYESIKSHWFDFSSLEKKRLPLRTAGWQPVGLTHISPDNNLVWPSPFGNRHSAFGTSWCSLPKKSISPSLNNNCHIFFDINSQFDLYISSPWAHFSRAWLSGKRLDPIHDFPQQLDGLSRVSIKMSPEKYISVLIISIHTSPDRMVVWPWTGGRESMEWGTVGAAVNTILPS